MTDPFIPPPYGPPPPYGTPPYSPPWAPAPPPNPLQNANLALGFGLGAFVLGVLSGLPALVFGIKALRSAGRAVAKARSARSSASVPG